MDTRSDPGRIHHSGPWDMPVKATDVLCSDGKRRTVYFRASGPDTFFSIPGYVRAYGKTISGYVSYGNDPENPHAVEKVLTFTAYLYGKNGDVLPEWPKNVY